mmetsp:Transcript_50704/g.103145  ORF Transcript_50704/g.103145 Transcript_50704/m.103145 type:complete len:178 (+) Transcript_50704:57-590(+)|eukprot:CAMPEP_0181288564 /NCGR_PEP_ID=MMETSP1101-20121128/401_1 /TAXON_ID=46948 /ORGANISM="Rhodomonas abbreviata, Strain Caron Lab Isolate" /LENGTH=177 /DNA_ID=CAMNT_0023392697 /DNA_START=53 /DNA_END=586 /DNA_ORIENTATION=-
MGATFAPRKPLHLLLVLCVWLSAAATTQDETSCPTGLDIETTLVLLKPDAVKRGHVGAAISQFELRGLEIMELKRYDVPPPQLLAEHYKEHAHRPFYRDLMESMSGPVVAISVRGEDAIKRTRELLGPTDPRVAGPRTLRGMFGLDKTRNFAHGSDSKESARREFSLWFGKHDHGHF